jgi:molybdenum cofactor cytidylyltransferase
MSAESSDYAIIILAAGNSSRLGEPKQLLKYNDTTLIAHIAESATETVGENVIVVTGSNASLIKNELHFLSCQCTYNADWQSGMASSIVSGIAYLQTLNPQIKGTIIAVSDQPFVTAGLFQSLITKHQQTGSAIVASEYDQTLGTPVFFASSFFPQLLQLTGAEGAKKLVKKFEKDVSTIPFPLGSMDIDTREDYQRLLSHFTALK